jgi:hypothetical protein
MRKKNTTPKLSPEQLKRIKRVAKQRVDRAVKRAIRQTLEDSQKASEIDAILRDGSKHSENLRYALRATLIELSNEIKLHVDDPGIASEFYRRACSKHLEPASQTYHTKQAFRHLDVLLNKPKAKEVSKLVKFYDDPTLRCRKNDPFPERKGKKAVAQ